MIVLDAPPMRTVLLITVLTSGLAHAQYKAAYVDFQRALLEVDDAKAAKSRVQAKADVKKKELEAEKVTLDKETEAFKKQEATMDDKARREKFEALMKRQNDLGEKLQRAQAEIAEAEQKEMAVILPKFQTIVNDIATREGLSMVFDRSSSGLAWATPSLDLTNELIRTYNNSRKKQPAAKGDAPKN